MRKLLPMLLCLLVPAVSFGQGSAVNDLALKNLVTGIAPAAGATVTVCTSAGTGIPCTPLATVYSDIALTVQLSNPLTADSNGYYSFYATPGTYVVTITGAGTSGRTVTYTLPFTLAGTNNFTGRLSTGNLNDILIVDGVKYANIAAAVTAAGSVNRTIILIPSTYAGSECPAYQANLVLWDFRGGNIICNQINSITYNSNDASGVNSLARLIHPIQGTTLPSGGSPVAWYQETYLVNTNFNNSQADGSSADLNFFGANSGTMPLASGHELAVAFFGTASGNASTGGTVTLAAGAHGYVQTLTGSTTAVTTVAGFDGIGCAGKITGAVPVNCYGLWGRRQLGAGSARNYGVVSEGVGLFQYDSNVAKGGFDCEDNGGTVRPCLFVDATGFPGARGALNLQAVSTDGLVLQSSDGLNKITILSATTTTNKPTRFGADATPSSAAGAFLGGCGLPWAGMTIGTGASNGYSFTPASAGACRTVNILDPGGTATLDLTSNTSTTATQVLHASATAGLGTYAAIATADIATALTAPGPIGGTTPGTGAFTTLSSTGNFTPSQTNGIVGTTTNNNANAGSVGEYVQSVLATGSSVTLATGVTSNVTSISLTAGDWDVTGAVDFTFGATTSYTNLIGSVSSTSATIGGQDSKFDFETPAAVPTAGADATFPVPVVRFSLSGTTTVFLVAQGTFTVSTLKAYGTIRARRIR